jgi:hypothetical protein
VRDCYGALIKNPRGFRWLGATPYESCGKASYAKNISRNISSRRSSTTSILYEFKIIEYDKFMGNT